MASAASSAHHQIYPRMDAGGFVQVDDGQWVSQPLEPPGLAFPGPPTARPDHQQTRSNRQSVSVACVPCRARHLKCGGGACCSRCESEGLKCSYVKSRRGFKGPRRSRQAIQQNKTRSPSDQSDGSGNTGSSNSYPESSPLDALTNLQPTNAFEATERTLSALDQHDQPFLSAGPQAVPSPEVRPPSSQPSNAGDTSPLHAFYAFFFAAHPFILPRFRLLDLLKAKSLPHLELAVDFVGSSYVANGQTRALSDALYPALLHHNLCRDGFAVQAWLLYAIGTHMNGNPEKAANIMDTAIDMALELGMNRKEFAAHYGDGDEVLAECWRRTWWQLFVVDGMISASIQRPFFRLQSVPSDTGLPCEEEEYITGNIPEPHVLNDYDDSAFASEEVVYSSFTYLIDAIRNLGRIMALGQGDPFQFQTIELLETSITNFTLHLPEVKRELINKSGQLDEILFQAHMVAAASSIVLHRPRSNLIIENIKNVKTCVKSGEALLPTQARIVHSAQAIRAAETISRLSTLPTPLDKHSPFFTCMITQAAVVHLSYWSFLVPETEDAMVKQQVKLDIGVLRRLSDMWPIGKRVLSQVKGVAQEMFAARKAMNLSPWGSLAEDDVMQCIVDLNNDEAQVPCDSTGQFSSQ